MTKSPHSEQPNDGAALLQMRRSLEAMLEDPKIPATVREALEPEYAELKVMLDKIEHGHVHIGVFGRVSVGKSSLLNALMGQPKFSVSPLHGETKNAQTSDPVEIADGQVFFIDTPGIDEIAGETREQLARDVAERCDLLLFCVEGDLTATELTALRSLLKASRPLLLVLNKADRYTQDEQRALLQRLQEHSAGLIAPDNVVMASADPAERIYLETLPGGTERETRRQPSADIEALKERLWHVLERDGKALVALNAGIFAGKVSDEIAQRITAIKRQAASSMIRRYCLAKGAAVALNPVPVTDLAAAAALDVTMVYHLSHVYGLPMTRSEAGKLVAMIFTQLALLMGTVWAMHLLSSALKTISAGFSVAVTALGQGAVAWYATYVVGRAARAYLENGASWGPDGPKTAVRNILDGIDRDSIIGEAREELARLLKEKTE